MRFSKHLQTPPSDPIQARGRRRAKLVGDIKAEIKEAAYAKGMTLVDLARILECNKSSVSRKLDAATNIEVFSMFDFAEALGKEWTVKLENSRTDTARLFEPSEFKTSWTPVVSGCAERHQTEVTKVTVKETLEFTRIFENA
jgi:transcriptional regulator with XRE-family HTH domain